VRSSINSCLQLLYWLLVWDKEFSAQAQFQPPIFLFFGYVMNETHGNCIEDAEGGKLYNRNGKADAYSGAWRPQNFEFCQNEHSSFLDFLCFLDFRFFPFLVHIHG